MPTLTIDNRQVTVPEGTPVIDAAAALGIQIPRFCYHPALGAVGACRVCAVNVLKGPVQGLQMSCMIPARDDMVVSTTAAEAVDFRKQVIEWLMVNHPHDCPVCDEGGHCLLQDLTLSGGHGRRRYPGLKRTFPDQDLGPLIQHEMNRCIHCYRCARYYREFSGYGDLGVMGIGARVYYGRFEEGTLESPFAGNLIDICPTGVYTDKPSRYLGRRWDFERFAAVCIHCGLGCGMVASARYREVIRMEARWNPAVNGHFICDRGRYGFAYASDPDRPRQASVNGQAATREQAVSALKQILKGTAETHGPEAVALAGSSRCSLETLAALQQLGRQRALQGPVLGIEPVASVNAQAAAGLMSRLPTLSLADLAAADSVLVIGVDPVNEAPMLALSLRQAARQGGAVTVLDPRPVSLPLAFDHRAVSPVDMHGELIRLGELLKNMADKAPGTGDEPGLERLVTLLRTSRRPAIVCATEMVPTGIPEQAARLVQALDDGQRKPGMFFVFQGANALGAACLGGAVGHWDTLLEQIESGTVRALVMVESDALNRCPDRQRLVRGLERLEKLVVLDCLPPETERPAGAHDHLGFERGAFVCIRPVLPGCVRGGSGRLGFQLQVQSSRRHSGRCPDDQL